MRRSSAFHSHHGSHRGLIVQPPSRIVKAPLSLVAVAATKSFPRGARWSKATKQVATLGPVSSTFDTLERLFLAGVDVFRLNFSHGSHEEKERLVGLIRQVEAKHRRPIAILADLQGPKHRVGLFPDGVKVALTKGQRYRFDLSEGLLGDATRVSLPHADVLAALEVGHRVLIDDGKLVAVVRAKSPASEWVECEVMNDAALGSRKGFNLPDTRVASSPLTSKDRKDLEFIVAKLDVDWVALSFVQAASDILEMQELANNYHQAAGHSGKYNRKLMAKLEKPSAVTTELDSIVTVSDGIMVARGDLGVEMVVESVPITQRRIIDKCHEHGKPVIVATQMLESMIESPQPTRAEVSDVATALFDGADAVMLSAESAAGKYPVEAVSTQQRIITMVESDLSFKETVARRLDSMARTFTTTDAITNAARKVAQQVGANAIVVFTKSGNAALRTSRDRPPMPILAIAQDAHAARFLSLAWGVDPFHLEVDFASAAFEELLDGCVDVAKAKGYVKKDTDLLVATAGFPWGSRLPGVVNDLRVVSGAGTGIWPNELLEPTIAK